MGMPGACRKRRFVAIRVCKTESSVPGNVFGEHGDEFCTALALLITSHNYPKNLSIVASNLDQLLSAYKLMLRQKVSKLIPIDYRAIRLKLSM